MAKSLVHDDLPYRPCVGIALFNNAGKVWFGKRLWNGTPEHEEPNHLWQWPQGGIDKGEAPLDAAYRELFEETNVKSVGLLKEATNWFNYDLQKERLGIALKGKYRGQTQKWFAFRFDGDDSEINVLSPGNGKHKAEFSTWRWGELSAGPDLVVPFKREVYLQVVTEFREFSQQI